jgi:hypothetical protein
LSSITTYSISGCTNLNVLVVDLGPGLIVPGDVNYYTFTGATPSGCYSVIGKINAPIDDAITASFGYGGCNDCEISNITPTPTTTITNTPTLTPTNTTTPTRTPTPTVTPTNTPYPPNSYLFYLTEGSNLIAPTFNGGLMLLNTGDTVTYNPNDSFEFYFTEIDKSGTSHPEYSDLLIYGGTITLTQGGNTYIASGETGQFFYFVSSFSYYSAIFLSVIQPSANPFVSGSPIYLTASVNYPVTPTPTPTNTPTNTPTPTTTPIPVTGYGYNLVVLPYNPPSSGNTIFPSFSFSGTTGITNPNTFDVNGVFWNTIDNLGFDRSNYYSGMTGNSVTAYFTQNGDTAIYSGSSSSFTYDGPPGLEAFSYNPQIVPGQLVLTQSASTDFVTGQTVYISYVVN